MSPLADVTELFSYSLGDAAFERKQREDEGKHNKNETRQQARSLAREVGRRRALPMLTSLIGLCVLGTAIIAQVTPASTQATAQPPMQKQTLKPKDMFKDCANCPEVVVVPAGSFTMGSPADRKSVV